MIVIDGEKNWITFRGVHGAVEYNKGKNYANLKILTIYKRRN